MKGIALSLSFAAGALAMTPAPSRAACSISDIEIIQADRRPYPGSKEFSRIVGEIRNRCAEPIGVALRVTFRDQAGKVVGVVEIWPASMRNVPANTAYPFDEVVDAYSGASTMSAEVDHLNKW